MTVGGFRAPRGEGILVEKESAEKAIRPDWNETAGTVLVQPECSQIDGQRWSLPDYPGIRDCAQVLAIERLWTETDLHGIHTDEVANVGVAGSSPVSCSRILEPRRGVARRGFLVPTADARYPASSAARRGQRSLRQTRRHSRTSSYAPHDETAPRSFDPEAVVVRTRSGATA